MSLARILEPEVMDSETEARDYDEMDHREVNQRFVDDFLAFCPQPSDVLDLGCGTAQIPIVLAKATQGCRIMAVDAAVAMLDIARFNVEVAGVAARIQLAHEDAKKLRFSSEMFGAVVSNSIIHHIPEPAGVLAEAVRVTTKGGAFFFRDLLRPDDTKTLESLVQQYAGEANASQQKMFADSLHAALSLEEIRAMVAALGFDPASVQATSDRHWTWAAIKA
jgi:ubiquinone/menaquinone biosynthesis C-methylase UbiE